MAPNPQAQQAQQHLTASAVDTDSTPCSTPHSAASHSQVLLEVQAVSNLSEGLDSSNGVDMDVLVQRVLLQSQYDLLRQADQILEKQEVLFRKERQRFISIVETLIFQEANQESGEEGHTKDAAPHVYMGRFAEAPLDDDKEVFNGPLAVSSNSNVMLQDSFYTAASTVTRNPSNADSKALKLGNRLSGSCQREFMSMADIEGRRSFRSRVAIALNRAEFEALIACAITLNALILCCECQYIGLEVGFNLQYPGHRSRAHLVWSGAETAFNFLDWFFGILYFLEMVVKLSCFGTTYFYDPSKHKNTFIDPFQEMRLKGCRRSATRLFWNFHGWNLLDFLCVVAFFLSKVATSSFALNPQMVRMLRLVRLFRLVRLLRYLETLDHLYVMTTSIAGLSNILGWAVVLLTIMLVACDLLLVQILQITYFDRVNASNLSPEKLKKFHEMFAYFGTCTRCMLSMFEITLGNWPPIARLLTEEVSEWFTLVCLVHKLTIGFSVVSVITGVILQETFKVAQSDDVILFRQKKKATQVIRQKLLKLFNALDEDKDGKLTLPEFMGIATDVEIRTWLASLDIETDDLKTLFELIDVDASGSISLDQLASRMPRIKGAARSIDALSIKKLVSISNRPCKHRA